MITYTEPKDAKSPAAGMTFSCGVKTVHNGVAVVTFRERVNGMPVYLRIDTRPELARLVAEEEARKASEKAERDALWAKEQAERDALIAAMNAEADNLRALIPADHVEVMRKKIADLDGDTIFDNTADGITLSGSANIVIHGYAEATLPGAMAPFATVRIASISRADLDAIIERQAAKTAEKAARVAAEEARIAKAFVDAKETGKPVAIESEMVECNDPHEECSTDVLTTYAMPDGSRKSTRTHTY